MDNARAHKIGEMELPRRERQAMDILYTQGKRSVAEIRDQLPGDPKYSAARMLMQRLHKKGLVTFHMEGPKYIYSAITPKRTAGEAALGKLVQTFFNGSTSNAFNALLGASSEKLSDEEFRELEALINQAKEDRK